MSGRRYAYHSAKGGGDGMEELSAKLSADLRGNIRALVRRRGAYSLVNLRRTCFYCCTD